MQLDVRNEPSMTVSGAVDFFILRSRIVLGCIAQEADAGGA